MVKKWLYGYLFHRIIRNIIILREYKKCNYLGNIRYVDITSVVDNKPDRFVFMQPNTLRSVR